MNILQILDKLFSTHPALSVAFSGFGITFLAFVFIKPIQFYFSKKKAKTNANVLPKTEFINSTKSTIEKDIEIIKRSINQISSYQEEIFVRYYHKYKHMFKKEDISAFEKQYEQLKQSFLPEYSILINKLIGLLESIAEE